MAVASANEMQTLSADIDHRSRRRMTAHALSSSDELIHAACSNQERKDSCRHEDDHEAHDWTAIMSSDMPQNNLMIRFANCTIIAGEGIWRSTYSARMPNYFAICCVREL